MKSYVATLCIRVITALALVPAVSLEAFLLRGVIRASAQSDAAADLELFPRVRRTASLSLLLLLLSGGYLTASASMWSLAWPKIAVAIVLLFGAFSGLSGRRMKQFRDPQSRASLSSRIGFLKASLGIRCGLVLAAVLLMSAQPSLMASVGIVTGLAFIGWDVAALPFGRSVDRGAGRLAVVAAIEVMTWKNRNGRYRSIDAICWRRLTPPSTGETSMVSSR